MNLLSINNILLWQAWSDDYLAERIGAESWGFFAHLVPIAMYAFFLIALIAIVMSILNLFKVPGAFKKALLSVLIFGGLLFVAWLLSGNIPEDVAAKTGAGNNLWKLASAGVTAVAVLGLIATLLLLFDLVKGLFKL